MGCNPDILENICPSGLRPSGLYFPIYPDYNPCIISVFDRSSLATKQLILQKRDLKIRLDCIFPLWLFLAYFFHSFIAFYSLSKNE